MYSYGRRPNLFVFVLSIVLAAVLGGVISLSLATNLGLMGQTKTPTIRNNTANVPNLKIPQGQETLNKGPIVAIAEQVGPAVVGISNMVNTSDFYTGSQLVEQGSGSGVIFDAANGYIVTNNHVVEGAEQLMVSLYNGTQVKAKLIGRDMRTDLAVVKIDTKNLTVAKFGNSDNIKVGEMAIAIGNPGGAEFARSVTQGIISGLNRLLITNEGLQFKLIQTDAAINPGNSGGALVNSAGEVVGINSIKIARAGFEGMGFAIPINMARQIIADLVNNGKVIRPALGVEMLKDVDAQTARYYGLASEYGVLVKPVPDSPSAQAGIKDLDIIIALDGQKVKNRYDLQNILFAKKVGDTIKVTVARNKQKIDIKVKLAQLAQ